MNTQSISDCVKAVWRLLHGDNRKWFDDSVKGQNTALYIELSYYIG